MATPCTVDVNNGRTLVQSRTGMTLYAALRSNGLLLPTGCGAQGKCGQCKVLLKGGDADLMTDPEVRLIPEDERAAGKRLACQLRLLGDVAVDIPDYVFDAREHTAVLREIIPLTYDIKRFCFTLPEGDSIPHKSGQFVTLVAKIPDQRVQVMRCFSFSTSSGVVDKVDLIVRRTPNGVMTPYLFERAEIGETFRIIGPYGDFWLRQNDRPCVWIAGGSGLSPFLGMIQDMLDSAVRRPVHLFFGAIYPKDLYHVDLFREIAERNDWFFRFTPALSGDERFPLCDDYGLVTDVVAKYVADANGMEGYLCGGPGMIGACVKLLTEKGMHRDNIYYDRF